MRSSKTKSRGGGGPYRFGWLLWGLALIAVCGQAVALTPMERDLKKVERYMNDGFCEDALKLATELSNSKEGEGNFEILFDILQAQYCLHDVASALNTAGRIRKDVTLDPGQELTLNTFVRTNIEAAFGELRLALPGEKSATVEVEMKKVGELRDPTLEPFYETVRQQMVRGVVVPANLYLPFGDYEIDQVERTIEDFSGIGFVLGKEKLSKWKRSQVGDGQALGFGFINFSGFGGLEHAQPGQDSGYIVTSERMSFSSTPYFEISSTHSTRLGTMGIVGLRVDVRVRPAAVFMGGVNTDREEVKLVPSYYSGALSIHLAIPGPKGITINGGFGVRGSYIEYVQYLGNLMVPDELGNIQQIPAGIDVGALGIGPELTVGSGWAFKAGESGVQVGIELQSGITVLSPLPKAGTVEYGSSGLEYEYELISEGALWGPHVGVLVFVRTPIL